MIQQRMIQAVTSSRWGQVTTVVVIGDETYESIHLADVGDFTSGQDFRSFTWLGIDCWRVGQGDTRRHPLI